jgi:hypothetical protein
MVNANAAINPIDRFVGDFEFLPVAAHFRYGAVPTHVTSDDFQTAAVMVSADLDVYAEAHWHLEAVRERRLRPGCALDAEAISAINNRVAARLFERRG